MPAGATNTFPGEGYDFFVFPQWGIPAPLAWLFAAVLFLLALYVLLSVLHRGTHLPVSARLAKHAALSLSLQFLCVWLSFAFFYHGLFQHNPHNFKLNAPTEDASLFVAIEEHQRVLENAHAVETILIVTLEGLRTPDGARLLSQLAHGVEGQVKSTYVAALSICIVGPPALLAEEDARFYTRAFGSPEETAELIRAQRSTLVTRPGLVVSALPAWSELDRAETQDLRSMLSLIRVYLDKRGAVPGKLEKYATEDDSERLEQYLAKELGLTLQGNWKVDLVRAKDAIELRRMMEEVAIKLGTARIRRFVDFLYFSLITIATVGYGDILPNSTTGVSI